MGRSRGHEISQFYIIYIRFGQASHLSAGILSKEDMSFLNSAYGHSTSKPITELAKYLSSPLFYLSSQAGCKTRAPIKLFGC